MQSVVSVKKPTVRAMVILLSDRHQIGHDLGESALAHVEVERERDQLVDDGNRLRVLAEVDRDHVTATRLAGVGAEMWQPLGVGEDRQLRGGLLAASRARHARVDPALAAPMALEHPRTTDQRFASFHQVRDLGPSAAAGTPSVLRLPRAGGAGNRPERLEHGSGRRPREVFVHGILRIARQPRGDDSGRIALAEPLADGRPEGGGPGGDGGVGDGGHDVLRHVVGQSRRIGSVVQSAEERALLRIEQSFVETQELARERVTAGEMTGATAAARPDLLTAQRCGHLLHQTFSMLTRNALNSGVRELPSPTNGVSALASQFAPLVGSRSAAMPTKPQWIGMPMWYTFLPLISSGPRRLVTTASTSSLPRLELTRTRSPVLIPFSLATSSGTSTNGFGWSPTRAGTSCVTYCSCSVSRYLV